MRVYLPSIQMEGGLHGGFVHLIDFRLREYRFSSVDRVWYPMIVDQDRVVRIREEHQQRGIHCKRKLILQVLNATKHITIFYARKVISSSYYRYVTFSSFYRGRYYLKYLYDLFCYHFYEEARSRAQGYCFFTSAEPQESKDNISLSLVCERKREDIFFFTRTRMQLRVEFEDNFPSRT